MKTVFLILMCILVSTFGFAQNKYDKIILNDGQSIDCYIVRVKEKNIFYHTGSKSPIEVEKLSLNKVKDYQFNGPYFHTNKVGILQQSEIIKFEGITREAIYESLRTWMLANSGENYLEDYENFILQGSLQTESYFNIDMLSIISAVNEEIENRENTLHYTATVRAKDNRAKIILGDFTISNNQNERIKTLKNIFEKRHTKDLTKTLVFTELKRLQKLLNEQIEAITYHCESAAKKEGVKSDILSDDDW